MPGRDQDRPIERKPQEDRQFEPPTIKKEGTLTRVINLSGFITVSGGRSD